LTVTTLTLDEKPAAPSLEHARSRKFWRDAGDPLLIPCVSKEGTIAVMAIGRQSKHEPPAAKDMALLSAVARTGRDFRAGERRTVPSTAYEGG